MCNECNFSCLRILSLALIVVLIFYGDCCHFFSVLVGGCDCCRFPRLFFFMPEHFAKVRMPSPFPVSEYIAGNPGLLDSLRFEAMNDAVVAEDLVDRNGIKRSTAVGGWKKR